MPEPPSFNADIFVESNHTELEPYVDSFLQLIIYGYKKLKESNNSYSQEEIKSKFKKARGEKAHVELENYLRNDFIDKYLKCSRAKFGLEDFIISRESPEIVDNMEISYHDIMLQSPKLYDNNLYYIVECKLISHRKARLKYYVDDGVKRFIDGVYYSKFNIDEAGMLAFAINDSSVSYFIDDIALEQAKQKNQFDYIEQLICNALASLNIHIKANAISFSKQP